MLMASNDGTFHSWPRLPNELKLLVLEHLVSFPTAITSRKHGCFIRLRLLPLLLAGNKLLAQLAKDAYYRSNTFRILLREFADWRCSSSRVARRIAGHVRAFEIVMEPKGRLCWDPAWSREFGNVKTLEVIWAVPKALCAEDFWRGFVREQEMEIAEVVASLGVARVGIRVDCQGCFLLRQEHEGETCACAREFEMRVVQAVETS
jgi:hypothetical protein